MACQICLNDYASLHALDPGVQRGSLHAHDPNIQRVQRLCGVDAHCAADVCSRCLEHHITAIVDDCVYGMLPRVRCPVCLMGISKNKWIAYIPTGSSLLSAYEQRAQRALGFSPPCCHEDGYTHLPECSDDVTRESMYDPCITAWGEPPSSVFKNLLLAYIDHRVAASHVVAFVVDAPREGDFTYLGDAMAQILESLFDEERRATLLLSFLYRFPYCAKSLCCKMQFCFNCKSSTHAEGEPCDPDAGFDTGRCMARCRVCRVMIVITGGCDAVRCPCGHEMSWSDEIEIRRLHRTKLLAVDLYDMEMMTTWKKKRTMLRRDLGKSYELIRDRRIARLIMEHDRTLARVVAMWRERRRRGAVE